MSGAASAIELQDFGLAYARGDGELVLLENVDVSIPAGGFYLLVGESGAGKSSLLSLLTGLWEPREPAPRITGRVFVFGMPVHRRYPAALRRQVAAVLQEGGLLDDLSPRANVELALRAAGRSPKLALGLLSQAGLDRPPSGVAELSGGMRKRVAVARALAADPRLSLFDEPTAGLDANAARSIAKLLLETHRAAGGRRTTLASRTICRVRGLPTLLRVVGGCSSSRLVTPPRAAGGQDPREGSVLVAVFDGRFPCRLSTRIRRVRPFQSRYWSRPLSPP